MSWVHRGAVAMALCMIVVGCGESTSPGIPTLRDIPPSEPSLSQPAPTTRDAQPTPEPTDGGRPDRTDPPGVPGSPIDYDSTIGGGPRTIDLVKGYIENQLEAKCEGSKVKNCGIKVITKGHHDCVGDVFPNPIRPGGTITMVTELCHEEPTEPTDEPTSSNSTPPAAEEPTQTTSRG